jgi:hypothetical protein
MYSIKPCTVEFVVDSELKDKKDGSGQFLTGFCKDLASGERLTFGNFVIYDEALARKIAKKAAKGDRMRVEAGKINTRMYERKGGGTGNAWELVVSEAKSVKS